MKLYLKFFLILISLLFSLFYSCKKSEIKDIEPSSKLIIEPSSLILEVDQYINTKLTAKFDGVELQPSEVKWSSKDTTVATIDERGFVSALWIGETEVTATLIDGSEVARCKVSVYDEKHTYKFRLILKDKGISNFSVDRPIEYLSQKAITRRVNHNIIIDDSDLPISTEYLKEIENIGGVIVAKSKWLKTVIVYITDPTMIDKYKQLPFIENTEIVWKGLKTMNKSGKYLYENLKTTNEGLNKSGFDSVFYGAAWNNIKTNNGQFLHEMGYKGAGIDIAVIDAGFLNIKTNPSLSSINIKGAKSFIYENTNPYDIEHGAWVTSCMAANVPGYYVGTAPEANYWLFRTEDMSSEYPVEQDYWVAALEYADSVGIDIVNSSLYYKYKDMPPYKYLWENLDGKTEMASRGANMAAEKGIFIVCCAGNDHSYIGTPGDSPNVLTVGSVNTWGLIDNFTSFGITVDGRIKPDVVALGGGACVIDIYGNVAIKFGTSYASPNICGLAACLWQAYPQLSNKELLDIIRKSANRYSNPELPYGYGVPDIQKAMQLARQIKN